MIRARVRTRRMLEGCYAVVGADVICVRRADGRWCLRGDDAGALELLANAQLDEAAFPTMRAALEAMWLALEHDPLPQGDQPVEVVKVKAGMWEVMARRHALFERRNGVWVLQRAPEDAPAQLLARSWPTLRAARLAYAGWMQAEDPEQPRVTIG